MDNAVALVQAYLRLNGYFTVAEYPIMETRKHGDVEMATDIDILAFRFPGAFRQIIGRHGRNQEKELSIPDPHLHVPDGKPDMIIGEVKEGHARINKSMRHPAVISAALARFGCCSLDHAEQTAEKLLHTGHADTPEGHHARIMVFAPSGDEDRRFELLPLSHVTSFLRGFLREHWEVMKHLQFRDPVLSMLMTLEKVDREPADETETGDAR